MSNQSYKVFIKKGSYNAVGPGLSLEQALISFMLSKGLATNPSGDGCTLVCCGSGGSGGGNTNLSNIRNSTTVTVQSDTGSDTILQPATDLLAGVMTAADKIKLDSLGATTGTPNELAFFDGSGTLDSYGQSWTDGLTLYLRVPDAVRTSPKSPYNSDAPLFLRHTGSGNLDIRFAYEGIDLFHERIAPVASVQSNGFITQQTYISAGTTVRTPLVGDYLTFMLNRITRHTTAPYDPYFDGSSVFVYTNEVSSVNGGTHEVGTTLKFYTRKDTDPINTNGGGNVFFKGDHNGDVYFPFYPQGRNDTGDPVNLLSTDVNGKVLSQPTNLFAWKGLDEVITGNWTFNNNVTMIDTPSDPQHLITKGYADALAFGLEKHYADLATTADITLSGEQTIDGTLTSASRVLVKDQVLQENNGVYLTGAGAWTRVTDLNTAGSINLALVVVISGATHANTFWTTIQDIVTLGTDDIIWTEINSPVTITAGNGLVLSGMTLDVVGTAGRIQALANSIDLVTTAVAAGSYGSATQIPTFTVDAYGRLTLATNVAVSIANSTLDQLSDVVITAPTNGQVLTYDTGTGTWINTTLSTTVTEAYIENFTGSVVDLDANVGNVKDVDGNNIAFTLPTDLTKFEVYRNGYRENRTGSLTTRGYSVNLGTHTITFSSALVSTDQVYLVKRG